MNYYNYYSKRLGDMMFKIQNCCDEFNNARNQANGLHQQQPPRKGLKLKKNNARNQANGLHQPKNEALFLVEAYSLAKELGGGPNDGALEVLRDLESNMESTLRFTQKWENVEDDQNKIILSYAKEVYNSLDEMKNLVEEIPYDVMIKIKMTLGNSFDYANVDKHNAILFLICVLIIILRFKEIITWSWIIVVPIVFIAAFLTPSTLRYLKGN